MVPAKPERPVLAWEKFSDISAELPPLFIRHWREVASYQKELPLDPHWERYFECSMLNILHPLTVRSNGVLVGYVFVLVYPHLHHQTALYAAVDGIWLDPAYRAGWTGIKMIQEVEKGMRRLGVKMLRFTSQIKFETERGTFGKVLERLGYAATEVAHDKFIG